MPTLELWQFGEKVAAVTGDDPADVQREINHYAAVYAQDGPVEIVREGELPKRAHPMTVDEIKKLWN